MPQSALHLHIEIPIPLLIFPIAFNGQMLADVNFFMVGPVGGGNCQVHMS